MQYSPPTADAALLVHAAAEHAVDAMGQHLLQAAQALVPVESGALQASGRVSPDGDLQVAVSFGQDDGAGVDGQDTAAYAIVQHEHLEFHHPNGGQAKYLETPLHSEADALMATVATTLRAALG